MSGARLVAYYGMDVVHDLAGLAHMICYFSGQASISVTACRKLLPDPAFYADCLRQSWQELQQAAAPAKVPVRVTRPRSRAPRKSRQAEAA